MTSVSIALATYNGGRYIAEQLDSLAKQSVLPNELVVTDDYSIDDTLAIVKEFAAKAPFPVHIVKNPQRLGYRDNFMKAASLCKSDLIAFCDQDDVWLPHKLKTCVATFENPDVLLAYHNATVVDRNLQPIGTMETEAAPQELNPAQSIEAEKYGAGLSYIFRRMLLDFSSTWPQSVDFYDAGKPEAHDKWFYFLASSLGTIAYIREPLVLYRQHGANTYGWHQGYFIGKKIALLLSSHVDDIQLHESSYRQRADALRQAQPALSGTPSAHALSAVAKYEALQTYYKLRLDLYAATNIFQRMNIMMSLLHAKAYRPKNQWGMGWQNLARDIIRGIVIPLRTNKA